MNRFFCRYILGVLLLQHHKPGYATDHARSPPPESHYYLGDLSSFFSNNKNRLFPGVSRDISPRQTPQNNPFTKKMRTHMLPLLPIIIRVGAGAAKGCLDRGGKVPRCCAASPEKVAQRGRGRGELREEEKCIFGSMKGTIQYFARTSQNQI